MLRCSSHIDAGDRGSWCKAHKTKREQTMTKFPGDCCASDTKRNTNRLAQHSIEERYPAISKVLLTISMANLPSALQSCSGNERRLACSNCRISTPPSDFF